MSAEYLEINNN